LLSSWDYPWVFDTTWKSHPVKAFIMPGNRIFLSKPLTERSEASPMPSAKPDCSHKAEAKRGKTHKACVPTPETSPAPR